MSSCLWNRSAQKWGPKRWRCGVRWNLTQNLATIICKTVFGKPFSTYLVLFPVLGILRILDTAAFGLHIHGIQNYKALKHTGVVSVCNHVHYMDCTMIALALFRNADVLHEPWRKTSVSRW